jgi:polar amino acid transport system ATP-binding protein
MVPIEEIGVDIQNLTKAFGTNRVIDGLSLTIPKGRLTVLLGPSGCGKTTLLRCLNGLEVFDTGRLMIAGTTIERPEHQGRELTLRIRDIRQRVGMVFQQFNLFPHLTALENLTLAPTLVRGMPHDRAVLRGKELLEMVGLGDKVNTYPGFLSGGQQQRVAIARALANEPEVLLYDEPTSALDPERVDEVLEVMETLDREGITQIVVTHEIAFAFEAAEHVVIMDHGHILEEGAPEQVLRNPQQERTRSFLKRFLSTFTPAAGAPPGPEA